MISRKSVKSFQSRRRKRHGAPATRPSFATALRQLASYARSRHEAPPPITIPVTRMSFHSSAHKPTTIKSQLPSNLIILSFITITCLWTRIYRKCNLGSYRIFRYWFNKHHKVLLAAPGNRYFLKGRVGAK